MALRKINMTDWQKVQRLFEHSNGRIISPMEIINHIHSVEYTGRIKDARNDWKCICGDDSHSCTATKHIVNIGKNKYIYKGISKPVIKPPEIKVSEGEVKYKLSLLRDEYRKAQNDTDKRLIELRAKALKNILNTPNRVQTYQTVIKESELELAVKGALL